METIGQWFEGRLRSNDLSLRQAAARTGLSHATIAKIRKGERPYPETIRKLAQSFGGDGLNQKMALEDYLLTLVGYRTPRPRGEEPSEALAQLMDKVSKFNESQLEMMLRFADFLAKIEQRGG